MRWVAGLHRRTWLAAVVSLLATLVALGVAAAAADQARRAGADLSGRLVPAARTVEDLAAEHAVERSSLRDYVMDRNLAARSAQARSAAAIPALAARLESLAGRDAALGAKLQAMAASHQAWLAGVAEPALAAAGREDWAAAARVQGSDRARALARADLGRVGALQEQITIAQATASARLQAAQARMLAALLAMLGLIAAVLVAGLVAVRRWLLAPFIALREAVDAVAAGDHQRQVPAVGPTELAELARSVETMRSRLLGALTEMESTRKRLRALWETSPDATVQVGGDGSILSVNAQTERMFGYPRDELVGQPVEALVPAALRQAHPGHRADYFSNPQFRPMGAGMSLVAAHRDGHEFPVEISLSSVETDSGPIVSAAVRDVSDRLAAQAERERLIAEAEHERHGRRLAQSQRLESLGQLVGGIAHDFNNLLNIILGYTKFTTDQVEAGAVDPGNPQAARWQAVRADLEQVEEAAQRAARLIHQLLAFGRREITKPEVLSLNDSVASVERLLRGTIGEHIELVSSLATDLWPVRADPGQLEQVLVNLAVNARDAMPSGGKLSIETDNTTVEAGYAATHPELEPGRYARLRVSDTGTGMDPATVARVFEPFFTTKPKGQGTGLGLATVYGIITQAGGHPLLHSQLGVGTTFTALLPALDHPAGPAEAIEAGNGSQAAAAASDGETILLVEDEAGLRGLVARILTNHDYQVRIADTAADALTQAGDLDQRIDLLLTDVVMPNMLGREVAARAQALRPDLPVLYMSGYAHDVLHTQGTLEPGVTLLEKPFTEQALLSHVHDCLHPE